MNFIKCWVLLLFICLTSNSVLAQDSPDHDPKFKKTVEGIGNIAQFIPTAASIAALFIFKDKKGAWQFAKAFTVDLATTYALKYIINKPRPEGATDGHAFPSGHVAFAFQGASFLQRRYGWKYGIPAYIVSGFVTYSRLDGYNDRHDGWDVLAGAVVGVGSTYLFTTPYEKKHLELSFNERNDSYLLGLEFKF